MRTILDELCRTPLPATRRPTLDVPVVVLDDGDQARRDFESQPSGVSFRPQGDPASRIENRVGESAANPYLYIASQILCGLDGVERGLQAPLPVETPYDADVRRLPTNLGDAIRAFLESEFMRRVLGNDFVDYYAHIKQAEWDRYLSTVSEWEHREYFSLF